MGNGTSRIRLLLMAFAAFFAVAIETSDRGRAPEFPAGSLGACAFDASDRSADETSAELRPEAPDRPAEVQILPSVVPLSMARTGMFGAAERSHGRIVGFGDTPPPRAG